MKVLLVATVMIHFNAFHLPYMKWFQEQGWEVHCAANKDIDLACCDRKHIISIERSPFRIANIKAYRQLRRLVQQEHYDVIHCHTPMGGVIGRLAARNARENGTKVLYTAHGFHFYKGSPLLNWILYYPIELFLAKFTDVLITINKEDYNRAQNFKAKKVLYVPGVGIDLKRFTGEMPESFIKRKREELGVPKDATVILSVGEMNKNKNHIIVMRALAELIRGNRIDRIAYLLCGVGPLEGWLKQKASDLGISNFVYFLGYRNDMEEIYRASDIFIFPSIREGLPVSLMEAMASGLPAICSDIRGNTDLVEDQKGGSLVPPLNVDAFVEAINKMLTSGNAKKMGDYNRRKIYQFEISLVLKKVKSIYCKL